MTYRPIRSITPYQQLLGTTYHDVCILQITTTVNRSILSNKVDVYIRDVNQIIDFWFSIILTVLIFNFQKTIISEILLGDTACEPILCDADRWTDRKIDDGGIHWPIHAISLLTLITCDIIYMISSHGIQSDGRCLHRIIKTVFKFHWNPASVVVKN